MKFYKLFKCFLLLPEILQAILLLSVVIPECSATRTKDSMFGLLNAFFEKITFKNLAFLS